MRAAGAAAAAALTALLGAALRPSPPQVLPLRGIVLRVGDRVLLDARAGEGLELRFAAVVSGESAPNPARTAVLRRGRRRAVVRPVLEASCPRASAEFSTGGESVRAEIEGLCGVEPWVYFYGLVAAAEAFVDGRDARVVLPGGASRGFEP